MTGQGSLWFHTPAEPDLGPLVQTGHGFEEDYDFHAWAELSDIAQQPHQAYARVKGGSAKHFQRCGFSMRDPGDDIVRIINLPPDKLLGGDSRPKPSHWVSFPVQTSPRIYWLTGEHRDESQPTWLRAEAVGHRFDIFENGTMSTVRWDDDGTDRDFNDHIVELALVTRTPSDFSLSARHELDEADLMTAVTEHHRVHAVAHRHQPNS